MTETKKRLLFLLLISCATGVAIWAMLRFTARQWHQTADAGTANIRSVDELWAEGVEKVKADRLGQGQDVALEVPAELKHYDDRRWFLATQVAAVHKSNVQSCQDYLELATLIQRGELVTVPAATEDYILFGVGARADDGPFTRYENDQNVELYDETQLRAAYARLDETKSRLQNEIAGLNAAAGSGKKRNRGAPKEIAARQQELATNEEERAALDQFYGSPDSRQKLFADYQALQDLAKNFDGRTYDLGDANHRQLLKLSMLRSIRPAAFKVMKEIAADYHTNFDRPLPVSSLVRPEQYQRILRRVNRAATTIDTPPHSTGLAFDIDYRYMSAAEQNFLMAKLARLKNEGRIEVLRERNSNYHVFVFIDGARPSDDLITASLTEVGPPAEEANHVTESTPKVRGKSQKATNKTSKHKPSIAGKQRTRRHK